MPHPFQTKLDGLYEFQDNRLLSKLSLTPDIMRELRLPVIFDGNTYKLINAEIQERKTQLANSLSVATVSSQVPVE